METITQYTHSGNRISILLHLMQRAEVSIQRRKKLHSIVRMENFQHRHEVDIHLMDGLQRQLEEQKLHLQQK